MKNQYQKYILMDRLVKLVEAEGAEIYEATITEKGQLTDPQWHSSATVQIKPSVLADDQETADRIMESLISHLGGDTRVMAQAGEGSRRMRVVVGNVGPFSISVWAGYVPEEVAA